jgi:hypothetical protein
MPDGRHKQSLQRSVAIVVLIIAAVLALSGISWLTGQASQEASSSQVTSMPTSTSPSARGRPVHPRQPVVERPDGIQHGSGEAWWTGCRQQITTGGALLSAQRTAAMHWAQHVAAQTSFDAKKITAAQAKAQWAASKAFGPADMAASAAAETAYRAAASACGTSARAVDPARLAAAHACSTFATKQAGAIGLGRAVVAQWAAHLDMMGHKADMTEQQYMAKWTAMVQAAAVPLAAFFAAAKAVHGPLVRCNDPLIQ